MDLEIVKQFVGEVSVPYLLLCVTGLVLFARWLLKTRLGRKSLFGSLPRRNSMPPYMPFLPLLLWLGTVALVFWLKPHLIGRLTGWKGVFLDNMILCASAIPAGAIVIIIAHTAFARRLRGFGFDLRAIHKDFGAALVNLLAILPLILAMVELTSGAGKLIYGPQFQIRQHEELVQVAEYPETALRVLIFITAILVVPIFEEMLFRGLFQTMIRSFLEVVNPNLADGKAPWLSIVFVSVIFAAFHANPQHWPALFVLSLCLGYSYEKSGSLFRPIFIHSMFNALSVVSVLSQ